MLQYWRNRMRTCFAPLLIVGLLFFFTTACTGPAPEYQTEVTIKDIMDSVVDPNADYVWQSVSTTATSKGIVEKAPNTDDDWREVRRHTIALMEATNALQIPGRRVARPGEKAEDTRIEEPPEVIQTMIESDPASWYKKAHGLYAAAALLLKATDAKNVDGLVDAGDQIDKACETCHLKYWYPNQSNLFKKTAPSDSVRKTP
jgi:hypothetical protein